jgi:hypothetical protein
MLGNLATSERLRAGILRERQIANALRDQVGLPICEVSKDDDQERKIDRIIRYPGEKPVALQIKFRETGPDLLFEVYDTFFGWGDKNNKLGRDMQGDATEYAVLLEDRKTVVMVPTDGAKKVIEDMKAAAKQFGWTVEHSNGAVFRYFSHGARLELRLQSDPRDGRPKLVAYIPSLWFKAHKQAKSYEIALPKRF